VKSRWGRNRRYGEVLEYENRKNVMKRRMI